MKLHELIQSAGNAIQWQWLSDAFIRASQTKRGTDITFGTQAVSAIEMVNHSEKYVGIIVWIPKEKLAPPVPKITATVQPDGNVLVTPPTSSTL